MNTNIRLRSPLPILWIMAMKLPLLADHKRL
ncbi:hypothetical protein NC653_015101 [Populus alba x Populus x berolinensis]|uniref:Uncharacterized protein n=1 Tax=Populus alba x Populus x berolinensis TaxID=444605 RepID=A0AAD6QYQ9_9ROSI|nr:hypothetical protein NC653_015101 [Populus alba x Populus x berolinensis]